jgi:hypothetical protein
VNELVDVASNSLLDWNARPLGDHSRLMSSCHLFSQHAGHLARSPHNIKPAHVPKLHLPGHRSMHFCLLARNKYSSLGSAPHVYRASPTEHLQTPADESLSKARHAPPSDSVESCISRQAAKSV